MELAFQLKYGTLKHHITTKTDVLLFELMKQIEEKTGVPVAGQKLIVNGRALTRLDQAKVISDCRIFADSKVMLLGKKFDPESDDLFKKVVEVEQQTTDNRNKLLQISKEVKDLENGHLAKHLLPDACKELLKRSRICSEGLMRVLECLDCMRFEEHHTAAKNKRRMVVNNTSQCLDQVDEVIKRIETIPY